MIGRSLVELAGLAAVAVGAGQVYEPAGVIVGGVLAVLWANFAEPVSLRVALARTRARRARDGES